MLSPVGPYYSTGFKPTNIFIEEKSIRTAPGGTGNHKLGA